MFVYICIHTINIRRVALQINLKGKNKEYFFITQHLDLTKLVSSRHTMACTIF